MIPAAMCASVSNSLPRASCLLFSTHPRMSSWAFPTTMARVSPSSMRMSLPESPHATVRPAPKPYRRRMYSSDSRFPAPAETMSIYRQSPQPLTMILAAMPAVASSLDRNSSTSATFSTRRPIVILWEFCSPSGRMCAASSPARVMPLATISVTSLQCQPPASRVAVHAGSSAHPAALCSYTLVPTAEIRTSGVASPPSFSSTRASNCSRERPVL
mmetsp:Transcript_33085/g.105433  ORF Transcript_33085/g.105433 Transcript_33085/m.105433 type:complete len:215 (+) Transcript_33085:169-813(+)